jgi:hypothetical protein
MAVSKPMQRLLALTGTGNSTTAIFQNRELWLDGLGFKEITIDLLLLQNKASAGTAILGFETSIFQEGPWTTLATYGAGYTHSLLHMTAREGGTTKFERYVRWKLDRSDGALANWETCFRICATMT